MEWWSDGNESGGITVAKFRNFAVLGHGHAWKMV
jgi:hypothetical protein